MAEFGGSRRSLDARRIASMHAQGLGWEEIAREMGRGVSTVLRVGQAEEKRGFGNACRKQTWKYLAFSARLNRS
jgi:transposase